MPNAPSRLEMARPRALRLWGFASLALSGCAATVPPPHPEIPLSPPSQLCGDSQLSKEDFCMPAAKIEKLFQKGAFDIEDVQKTKSGIGGAKVMVVEFPKTGLTIRAKWKEAKVGGEGLDNS